MRMRRQSGQVLVLVAVGLVAMIGMAGLIVDGGRAYSYERSLEAAAEGAAHAGAYLLETSWNGDTGNFGSLTDAQVRTAAQYYAQLNGWNSANGDTFYMDYVYADRTTHVATLDTKARGVFVQLAMPQTATFTRILGFRLFSVFARATAMFGAAVQAGAIPLALDDGCAGSPPQYYVSVSAQPANGSGSFGTCNFGSIVPPGCTFNDISCYANAMKNGMRPPVQLGIAYPINAFDYVTLAAETSAALQLRIDQRPLETCTTFNSPSPRVVWMPVVPGGFGGASLTFVRYRAFFLTSITPPQGFTGCFVKATINGGDFDPNAVGTAYGGVMIMKLVRSSGSVVPTTVTVTTITSPAVRSALGGASLTIHANQAGALCTVIVNDLPPAPGQPSHAGGLGPQYTDASGNTTWTWTVEPTAIAGSAQVQVTCSYHALLGFAFTTMLIA
jgi:Putative Flp pilus-assembly TadE/G-like